MDAKYNKSNSTLSDVTPESKGLTVYRSSFPKPQSHFNKEAFKKAEEHRIARRQPLYDKIIEAAEERGFTSMLVTVAGAKHSRDMEGSDDGPEPTQLNTL